MVDRTDTDVVGRFTNDYAASVAGGFKASIRELTYDYDGAGRLEFATSRGTRAGGGPGAGAVSNQVQRVYNGLGQMIQEYQEHNGSVNTGTSEFVEYTYSGMPSGANHSRLVNIIYPELGTGTPVRTVHYEYSSGVDANISRVTYLSETNSGGTKLEEYAYLGHDTVVERFRDQPDIALTYIGGDGDDSNSQDWYTGLDQFGRVSVQRWDDTGDTLDVDRFAYAYDRNSNVLYRENQLSSTNSELYHANDDNSGDPEGYDALDRLTHFRRGTLSDGGDADSIYDTVTSPGKYQTWTLDALGNWSTFDNNGSSANRTHNRQNQITSSPITHDGNGNVTALTSGNNVYTYDAWNRMVQFGAGQIASQYEYPFDALHRRIQEDENSDVTFGTGQYRDLYYSDRWQVIADYLVASTQSDLTRVRQSYVWTPGYVDEMVTRERRVITEAIDEFTMEWSVTNDTTTRVYVQQDANFNVTSLTDTGGTPIERYQYDPYGGTTILTGAWGSRSSSSYDWIYNHQGGRYNLVSKLYHFRNRDYSATWGRWMQQDPAGYVDGASLYQALISSPVTWVDPFGLRGTTTQSTTQPATQPTSQPATQPGPRVPTGTVQRLGSDEAAIRNNAQKDLEQTDGLEFIITNEEIRNTLQDPNLSLEVRERLEGELARRDRLDQQLQGIIRNAATRPRE